ncbi:uncharacterized protein SPPG_06299 [Spizellomyces punctatus DAOM BR117]|uniref:Cwf18 pre-mRNA splicing factor n=1 Tax=Spizellomyces punctatus (strain DAOM BR117) TaxID=645134 RepID=A0A0L0HCL1_SPIPD|nr:uncharacterized protein SPPG_06299 [Spizellomyces punctatus DAOM BR117]KNC98619.1 hypothetical protein SPPG_06299 [Spizellomyces punctatus DAOM BR117]|eukprot:XP_016606659.1 hypothetical protein SPPG_06299 [Spizellomyces punctatus DAOM BR117]
MLDLQEEAKKRKERLAALKALRSSAGSAHSEKRTYGQETSHSHGDQSEESPPAEDIQEATSASNAREGKSKVATVEEHAEEVARIALETEAKRKREVELLDLAPKKPNWDLKRDLEQRMDRLQRKTQGCIAELIRARLREEGDLSQVSGAAEADRMATDSDDE